MRLGLVAWCLLGLVACGLSRLPGPPLVAHSTSELVEVPFPPPPPRAEFVPDAPAADAVWIDGEWVWRAGRWAWRRGRWVRPDGDARFSPWTSVRDRAGTLYVAEGAWRDAEGRILAEPEPLATARTTHEAVVDPEGDEVALPPVPPVRPR